MNAEQYWNEFTDKYPDYKEMKYTAWAFGAEPDELAELVVSGRKTLTWSGLKLYEADAEPLPEMGEVSIVLNTSEEAVCVIETTKVYTVAFRDVDETIAYKEGEGDRTLAYWRQAHLEFFIPEYDTAGLIFNEEEIIVIEEFKKIYS